MDFCPHEEKVSLSFNLIIGRWTEKAQARKRSEKKTGDGGNLLVWLKGFYSKPLKTDRNRRRRSDLDKSPHNPVIVFFSSSLRQ